jgi:GT2 family glycosyltransferase
MVLSNSPKAFIPNFTSSKIPRIRDFQRETMSASVLPLKKWPTMYFLEKNTLSKLVEASEKETAGIFSPLIYNRENNIWFAGGKINWLRMKAVHENNLKERKLPFGTDYVSGCAMLVKKEVFKKIGLLSEDYFLYYEDSDFCARAKKKKIGCMVVPGSKMVHFEKSESDLSTKIYWLVISGLIFFEKNTPDAMKFFVRPYLHLRKVKNMLDNLNDKNKYAPIVKKAYFDFKIWKQNRKYPLSS